MSRIFIGRTRFGEIVAEFAPPLRPSRRVVVFASGMPTGPSKASLAEFFARKGYWCFVPRYRGTWESGGKFLRVSPERDIKAVMDGLERGFRDAYSGKKYRVARPEIFLFGSSFGGAATLLLSGDRRVKKVVALSPVVDWRAKPKDKKESLDRLAAFLRLAFGEAYRFSGSDVAKLKSGKFYNPSTALRMIDGRKIFIVHAKDDRTIPASSVKKFAKETNAALLMLPRGGHGSAAFIMKPAVWKRIRTFLKRRTG